MKFVCFREFDDPAEPVLPGVLRGSKVLPLSRIAAAADALEPRGLSVPEGDERLMEALPAFSAALARLEKARLLDKLWSEVGMTLLAPLPRPRRILAIGRNYAEHARELGNEAPAEPIVFLKASTSVIADGQPIVLPPGVGRVDFEGELAVVIGRGGRNIRERDALSHVAGYTLFNDVTARDAQKRAQGQGLPWFLSKGYDTFGPMGPCLVTADDIPDPARLSLTLTVNGDVRQQASVSEMLFSVPQLIAYLSGQFTIEAGDVILTGTPPGVGPLNAGDVVSVSVPEIGTLTNPVLGDAPVPEAE